MKDSSNISMKNIRTVGYDKGFQVKNTNNLIVENLNSSGKHIDLSRVKWYKDIRFWISIFVTMAIAIVTWVYFS